MRLRGTPTDDGAACFEDKQEDDDEDDFQERIQ
jgi:hypothetical protein